MFKHPGFSPVLIVLAACVTPSPGQNTNRGGDDRAKQLFQQMEGRLAKAQTLECAFEITDEFAARGDPRSKLLLEGYLFLAEGNRARQEINERADGRPTFHMLVSDGMRWWWYDKGSPPHLVNTKPYADLNADFLTALARTGLSLPNLPLPPVEAADSKERFPVSGFRLGPKEKIGEREAQRLEYQLFIKGQKEPNGEDAPFSVTVWLDPQTSLPIQRVVVQDVLGMRITESYDKLILNGKVDAKRFELPKETKETIIER